MPLSEAGRSDHESRKWLVKGQGCQVQLIGEVVGRVSLTEQDRDRMIELEEETSRSR